MPGDTVEMGFCNGFLYTRLRPLISPDRATTKLPPTPVLWLAVRLHPEMRRRAKRAATALEERPWRKVAREWGDEIRPRLERENAELQAVDVEALDDVALVDHIDRMLDRCRQLYDLHFYLHAFDLGPIGRLLAGCEQWGIPAVEVIPALAGASPSTSAPAQALDRLRALVKDVQPRPRTVEGLKAVSAEVAGLVDEYLARRGRMLVTRYDLDGATLEEQPDVLLATVFDGTAATSDDERVAALTAAVRARVPEAERGEFDERLAEARASMDLRDDNGPNTVGLPVGILRYALLELGRRLAGRGRVHDAVHVLELGRDEVVAVGRGATSPTAEELAARAAERARQARLDPPLRLGPVEATPPLTILPPLQREMIEIVQTVMVHLGMAGDERAAQPGDSLAGSGVGTESYEGTARVADTPEDALAAMEPGDVLVVRFTTPAFNTVLTLAGAVVTAEGALLSHAAVMARELGIPAVIGASGALTDIPDGSRVEVDPVAGRVRVLSGAPR
jgi:pyruvate,water dikinase